MWRKIVLLFCLLLFAAAVAGGPQVACAKDQKKNSQQHSKQTQSFKQKCEQKLNQIKAKVKQRMEQKNRTAAVCATRG